MKKFVGGSYFPGDINPVFAKYVTDAGFHVLDMVGMEVAFDKVQEVSELEVYKFIKKTFQADREADGIYLLGTAWHAIDIIEMLEDDLGVPVVHSVPAQSGRSRSGSTSASRSSATDVWSPSCRKVPLARRSWLVAAASFAAAGTARAAIVARVRTDRPLASE